MHVAQFLACVLCAGGSGTVGKVTTISTWEERHYVRLAPQAVVVMEMIVVVLSARVCGGGVAGGGEEELQGWLSGNGEQLSQTFTLYL